MAARPNNGTRPVRTPPLETSFTVERREIIATIEPGDGPYNPITTAFMAAGEYLAEDKFNGEPVTLSFTVYGVTFTATNGGYETIRDD